MGKTDWRIFATAHLQNYDILEAPLQTWRLAKSYRANQQRAYLRADVITQMLEHDCIPSCYLGAKTLPRYLLPLSDTMCDTFRRHGREKATLSLEHLRNQCISLRKRADNTLALLRSIYQEEGDPNFTKASELIKVMVYHYRGIEVNRLQTLFKKELEKKPKNNTELGLMMVKDLPVNIQEQSLTATVANISNARNDRQQRSPAPKRRRANGGRGPTPPSSPRGNQQWTRAPQTRGNGRQQRGRGRQSRGVNRQRNFQQPQQDYPRPRRSTQRGRGNRNLTQNDYESISRQIANLSRAIRQRNPED